MILIWFLTGVAVGAALLAGICALIYSGKEDGPVRVLVNNESEAAIARQAGYEPVYKFTREKK